MMPARIDYSHNTIDAQSGDLGLPDYLRELRAIRMK
jgi:hypothetical protein